MDFAINAKFLDGFFKEQRGAIMGDLLTEFDQEAYDRHRRAEGFAEGAQQTAIANAKNFLKKSSLSAEMIAECCSLPLEQVLSLKEEVASMQNA